MKKRHVIYKSKATEAIFQKCETYELMRIQKYKLMVDLTQQLMQEMARVSEFKAKLLDEIHKHDPSIPRAYDFELEGKRLVFSEKAEEATPEQKAQAMMPMFMMGSVVN